MIKNIILILMLLSILLTGCSFSNSSHEVSKVKVEEKTYTRKMTDEEKGYIQLVLNKDYETLELQTKHKSNDLQKDYNSIGMAMFSFNDAKRLESVNTDNSNILNNGIKSDYETTQKLLSKVKYAPKEIKSQIDEMNTISSEKINFYSEVISKQETAQKLKQENPSIGMTADQVLLTKWGKPKYINKTTTVNGTNEQWVYDWGYVYLDNGIVTAIQN